MGFFKNNNEKEPQEVFNVEEKLSQLEQEQQEQQNETETEPLMQNESGIKITEDVWGPLWPYINEDSVTDIDFNGMDLRVRTTSKRKRKVDTQLTKDFVDALCNRIANEAGEEFNIQNPVLEADADFLRFSAIHESRNKRGKSICIRRVPNFNRITPESAIADGYMTPEMLSFLINCVHAHCNFTIAGDVGVGKTELLKFLSLFIPDTERVVTMEEKYEINYSHMKPNADCVELKVDEFFTYSDAIKTCLQQNADWLILAEVRDKESKAYLKQLSTGVNGMNTLHTDDVRNIPRRIVNMIGETEGNSSFEEDAYTFLDIGILLEAYGDKDGNICRYIDQVCVYENQGGDHIAKLLYTNGRPMDKDLKSLLPKAFLHRLQKEGIEDPFYNEEVENILKTTKVGHPDVIRQKKDIEPQDSAKDKGITPIYGADSLYTQSPDDAEQTKEDKPKKPRLKEA